MKIHYAAEEEANIFDHLCGMLGRDELPPTMRKHVDEVLNYAHQAAGFRGKNTYHATFVARQKGNTDLRRTHRCTVHGYTAQHALTKLYARYENIGQIDVVQGPTHTAQSAKDQK